MRPDRVAGDRERPDAHRRQIVAPVTQEQDLVRSGGRPVPEVEAEERVPRAEHLLQWAGLLARRRPDLDVGDASPGSSTRLSLSAHPPSILGNERERNCSETFATPRIPAPFERTKTHWSAAGQPRHPAAVGRPRRPKERRSRRRAVAIPQDRPLVARAARSRPSPRPRAPGRRRPRPPEQAPPSGARRPNP